MRKRDDAAAAYQLAPARVDIENKERALSGGDKAMAGLQAFVDAGSDGDDEQLRAKRSRAAAKLQSFGGSEAERQAAVDAARAACSEWQQLCEAESELDAMRTQLGLPALEAAAKSLERQKGVEANKGGRRFEEAAGQPLGDILAAVSGGDEMGVRRSDGGDAELVVLNRVTLGMAKAEIDFLICKRREVRRAEGADGIEAPASSASAARPDAVRAAGVDIVEEPSAERKRRSGQKLPEGVLLDAVAICEVKRDSSDLGIALTKSAEVMAWLSGERDRYQPDEWTNRFYPTGHFGLAADGVTERAHACTNNGGSYLFDRASFAAFRSGSEGHGATEASGIVLPSRLHIITSTRRRAGYETVRPLSSKAFGKLQHKAARDIYLLDALQREEAADAYEWEGLRRWLREASGPLSAVGALRIFAADEAAAQRLHVEIYQDEVIPQS